MARFARPAGSTSALEIRRPEEVVQAPVALQMPNGAPPPLLAQQCDRLESWPPAQRLTAEGSLTVYYLVKTVGSLLDAFGVKWWASAGALLGAVRNGGLLPQDCDVDFAIWRPDASQLVRPAFRAALAAAGIASYQVPIYFQFRFCLSQVPALADHRSVDAGLTCYLPYIDGHLVDRSPHAADSWYYIHRTDLQYARSHPLSGIFQEEEGKADRISEYKDVRQRIQFGEHAEVWAPQKRETELYLDTVYGSDWRYMIRGRDNLQVFRTTESGTGDHGPFWGSFSRPSGPLKDLDRPSCNG